MEILEKKDEMHEVNELERFRREVKNARKLLDFAISEGDVGLNDGIIQEINEATEFLDPSKQPPCAGQRVAFDKAYRDLVKLLHPVTLKSLRASSWLPMWSIPLIFFLIFAILVIVSEVSKMEWTDFRSILGFGLISFGGTFFLWFLDLFTGVVSKEKVIEIIIFCYVFTFSALVGSFLMFVSLGWQGSTSQGSTLQGSTLQGSTLQGSTLQGSTLQGSTLEALLPRFMYQGPIGVVKGCITGESDKDWFPSGLRCRNGNEDNFSQWVFNVGGTIVNANSQGNDDQLWPSVKINGGMVVPLYVVILSLMGAAISMTRRVPEYQRRVYLKKGEEGDISREKARECLVFQIMQFFTAPLLAITAYYLLQPNTREMSVVLGFASGFASETVLHAIGALVEKLKPSPAKAEEPVGQGAQGT